MMSRELLGIHHVTAITSDVQRNVDFYTDLLGLRLVKVIVNFNDPGAYHLYYGDEVGHPGTILTFFAWPGAPRGRAGTGQLSAIATREAEPRIKRAGVIIADMIISAGEFALFNTSFSANHFKENPNSLLCCGL
jgi:catechol 2,3-dioxygenase-like lactoylglutathione lyase family enzyme